MQKNLIPVITGEEKRPRLMFGEFYGHQTPYSQRIVRSDEFKYIFNSGDIDEFYDLENDPGELSNKIDCDSYRTQIKTMQEHLRIHLTETEDKILRWFERSRIYSKQ